MVQPIPINLLPFGVNVMLLNREMDNFVKTIILLSIAHKS